MTTPSRKLNALTGLRFLAAAVIVVHHTKGVLFLPADLWGRFNLAAAVSFFFVLSGFILAHVYPRLDTWGERGRFLLARFARLWPAHLCATAGVLVLYWTARYSYSPGKGTTLLNLFLLQSWVPRASVYWSYNIVAWSISTELGFYLCFLLLIPNWRRTWFFKLPLTLALAGAMIVYAGWPRLPETGDPFARFDPLGMLYVNPLSRLFEFAVGMTAALVWSKLSGRVRYGRGVGTLIEVSAVALVLAGMYAMLPLWGLVAAVPQFGSPLSFWLCGWGACSGLFALLILVMAAERGWLSWLLATPPLVLLGEISFTIYLFHQVLIRYYTGNQQVFASLPGWLLFAGYWFLLLVLSHLVWSRVEQPLRRFLVGLWPNPDRVVAAPVENVEAPRRRQPLDALFRPGWRLFLAELSLVIFLTVPAHRAARHAERHAHRGTIASIQLNR